MQIAMHTLICSFAVTGIVDDEIAISNSGQKINANRLFTILICNSATQPLVIPHKRGKFFSFCFMQMKKIQIISGIIDHFRAAQFLYLTVSFGLFCLLKTY